MLYFAYDEEGKPIGFGDNPNVYERYVEKPDWFPEPDTDDFFVLWKKARVVNGELIVQQE